jgi:hypothetical protein
LKTPRKREIRDPEILQRPSLGVCSDARSGAALAQLLLRLQPIVVIAPVMAAALLKDLVRPAAYLLMGGFASSRRSRRPVGRRRAWYRRGEVVIAR